MKPLTEIRKEEQINIVSFGAGQNSTAMIILMNKEGIRIDEILFAETDNEMPKTYEFLIEFKKWCSKNDLNFVSVKSKLGNLREYYMEKKVIPYRMFRHCTHKFKVVPIMNYIKEKYGIKQPINMYMGISYEEKKRCMKISGRKQINFIFPLVEKEIDREGCIKIIKEERLSVPVKSGCYFCPFQSKKEWIKLYQESPNLFKISKEFEENGRAYPKGNLMGNMTLKEFEIALKEQKELFPKEDVALIKCAWCHS